SAIKKMRAADIPLFNQSVLLKDVNDSASVLIKLSEALFETGITPYYLHLLDKVQGTAHFEVEEVQAKNLYAEMLKYLPGYLVPKLVREEPGAVAKSLV